MSAATTHQSRPVCPQCGSWDTRFTYPTAIDNLLRLLRREFAIYRCRLCLARFRLPKQA
jgi:hypothetical protein